MCFPMFWITLVWVKCSMSWGLVLTGDVLGVKYKISVTYNNVNRAVKVAEKGCFEVFYCIIIMHNFEHTIW